MAPAKQVGRKVERRDMTAEERAAEADYQRLVEAAKQLEGKESYWEQEVRKLGGGQPAAPGGSPPSRSPESGT